MKENFNSRKIKYHELDVANYVRDLKLVGSLSNLFSDSKTPFLHYRASEMIYCATFGAENLAKADVSADAKLRTNGIGIKTFIASSQSQKIAEFNKQQELYKDIVDPLQKARKLAELRNARLQFTMNAYGLTELFYHCILRNDNGFFLCEEVMQFVDINKIRILPNKEGKKSLVFTDGKEFYKFDNSKSTLYKRFKFDEYFAFVPVDILENPLEELRKLAEGKKQEEVEFVESAIIPLYSASGTQGKFVAEKSGLNQWNAGGRARHHDEVYIPFNKDVRELYENFFPPRDTKFEVTLPNGNIMSMKICQDGGKAIMSDPNKDLGKWLLRDVLQLRNGQVLTYDMLLQIGIDAVEFQKLAPLKYKLDFKEVGEFEEYISSLDR